MQVKSQKISIKNLQFQHILPLEKHEIDLKIPVVGDKMKIRWRKGGERGDDLCYL